VADRPGVLADVTRALADSRISIDAMVQKEPGEGEKRVDIVMLTHLALEKNVNAAMARIEELPAVHGGVTRIRLEQLL
jgi:homoserine dehydrogenase